MTAALILPRADLSGAVRGEERILCFTTCFCFFSCNTFRPADYGIYEQYVLAAHIWMMVSFVFVQGAGGDVMIKWIWHWLLCSAIVTKPICIRSFVHFSIDPEAVILKYISLGITQLMQTFQKRKMSQLCGFFFFSFYAVTSLVSLSLHVTLFSGESEIKS